MKYLNALNVFPDELLVEIRKYIPEGFLYIPGIGNRKEWGSKTGHKYELDIRNKIIYTDYQNGKKVVEISKEHYLSESSIYRIINNYK